MAILICTLDLLPSPGGSGILTLPMVSIQPEVTMVTVSVAVLTICDPVEM